MLLHNLVCACMHIPYTYAYIYIYIIKICKNTCMQSMLLTYNNLISAPSPQWCMVDLTCKNDLLETVECPNCRVDKALYVCDDRKGFALHLPLMCSKCDAEIGDTYSSPTLETSTKPSPFMINDTLVLFFYHRVRAHCSESVLWYSRNTSHATEDFPEEREKDYSEGNRGHL